MTPKNSVVILMADDDEDDILLTQKALQQGKLLNELICVRDGEELLDYLFHQGAYTDAAKTPRPGIILLDLNMPRKDGREALKEIKANPDVNDIPVVVFTTSKAEEDIYRSYKLGVNSFITKPVTFDRLIEVMQMIGKYWFEIVTLPPRRTKVPMETQQTVVLLIEDDEEDYILLQKVLAKVSHAHYVVKWEQHFAQGLRHMQEQDHDICLVDYRLGAASGIDLLREARRQGYNRPIIVLTGASEGDIDIQALQAGADDYITKGLLQGDLLHRLIRYAIERRKAEQEREQLVREQIIRDEREARRNEFTSMIVHELKTPLSSLKGYSQLLGKRYERVGDEQGAHLATRMDQQVNKLTGLIDELLDVTRLEGGQLPLRESTFAFDELIDEVVADIQLTAEQHAITREGWTHATIQADRERIGQVLTNLLTNAIKYAPDSKIIAVRLTGDTQSVTVCVQDSGPGIPEANQARIFEPFYRIESPDHTFTQGLGLGLAIAAGLVERHHGKIWVESVEGAGATFCFTLPLVQQPASQISPEQEKVQEPC